MLSRQDHNILIEANATPVIICRLYGSLYGRPGAIDWEGHEKHGRCETLATQGLLENAGLSGGRADPQGQFSRWIITDAGRLALPVETPAAKTVRSSARRKLDPNPL